MRSPRVTLLFPLLALLTLLNALPGCSDGRNWQDDEAAVERLKNVGVAMQFYAMDHHSRLPPVAIPFGNDTPPVSWRVLLSPYVAGPGGYKRDEPWDSPHNQKFLKQMPDVFKPAGGPEVPEGYTRIRAIVGTNAGFDGKRLARLADGKVLILVVETDEAVPWTKPEDWQLDPNDPLKGLGQIGGGRFLALDNRLNVVRVLNSAGTQRVLEAMLDNDGKPESTEGLIEKIETQKR